MAKINGKKCPKTFPNIRKLKCSYSSLKAFRKSPLHFMEYKFGVKKPPTPAMVGGSIVDVLVLTPDEFDKTYAVSESFNKRTKDGKAAAAQFAIENEGKKIITTEQLEIAKKQAESVKENPYIKPWLDSIYRTQVKLEWTHKETGLQNIGFVDAEGEHPVQGHFIADLKTAKDASNQGFMRDAYNLEYFLQAGAYLEGYVRKSFQFPLFIYIVVENTPPYAANLLVCDSKYTQFGRNEYLGTLKLLKYCQTEKKFDQGYEFHAHDGFNTMVLPGYAKEKTGLF